MLKLDHVGKSFSGKRVLSDVSLLIPNRTAASLSGMSGSGKTTLLRIAAGLEKPDCGTVSADGRIAVVFAEPRLFDSVSVLENVTCVMSGSKKENEAKAEELLAALKLENAVQLSPRELSSGMAARVSVARALAYDADIYLLDEPFKSLDEKIKYDVMTYLKFFFEGKTVLLVTHDDSEAKFLAAHRFYLADGVLSARKEFG